MSYDWEKQTQTVQDERAKAFEAFQRAVGGCSLTAYQAEADIEIEARIKSVVYERDLLLKALRGMVGVETLEELDQMEAVIRATVGPASDKAAILDAIDALRKVTR